MIFQSSAEVTAWPERIALTLVFLLIIGLIYFSMYRNWQRKANRDRVLGNPLQVNERLPLQVYRGRYIATTYADDWLKRVHIRGMTLPSLAELQVFCDGIAIVLKESEVFIPFEDISKIDSIHALAGKVFESDGLIAITWKLETVLLVTGFRAETANDHIAILEIGAVRG